MLSWACWQARWVCQHPKQGQNFILNQKMWDGFVQLLGTCRTSCEGLKLSLHTLA